MKRDAALVPLSRQHHDALALGVMIDRALNGLANADRVRTLRDDALQLWEFELRGHFEVEETVVFPSARDYLPDCGIVTALLADHEAIRGLIGSLDQAAENEWPSLLSTLRIRLVRHIRIEERVFFQAVQEHVPSAALAALGEAIDNALPFACIRLGSAAARRKG